MKILESNFYKSILAFLAVSLSLFFMSKAVYEFYQARLSLEDGAMTLSVTGEAKIDAQPDLIEFDITAEEIEDTSKKAQDKASKKINKIIDFAKSKGVDDKDIKTSYFDVSKYYEWNSNKGKREFVGYKAVNRISIKTKDKDLASEIVAKAMDTGASNVSSFRFKFQDDKTLKEKVKQMAIEDAKRKAKTLADSLGVSILRMTSFSDGGQGPYPVLRRSYKVLDASEMSDIAVEPQIELGTKSIRATVTLQFLAR